MPTDAELKYYYFGFHTVLTRYRVMTMIGWSAVSTAIAGVIIGWEFGRFHGLLDIAISACAIVAGVSLVQMSVASLTSYLQVPFGELRTVDKDNLVITEITKIMQEVDDGGWQEAFSAIGELRKIGEKHSLPALD